MEEWKREIVKLWVTRMSDSDYLKKLVESMPRRRMAEVIEKRGATSGDLYKLKINVFLYMASVFFAF